MMPRKINRLNQQAPDQESSCYKQMQQDYWELIHDLLGGTKRMRECGTKWLPRYRSERFTQYKDRVQRSVLYEAFKDTIEALSAKPFSQPVTVHGATSLPERLRLIENDVEETIKTTTTGEISEVLRVLPGIVERARRHR